MNNHQQQQQQQPTQQPPRVVHPRTSRPRPVAAGNEEASTVLNLGEFQDVDTLTLSEASLVINALVAKRRNDRKNINETECVRGGVDRRRWRRRRRRRR
jgi:DNA-directed RNA polymerase II subunit RPB4